MSDDAGAVLDILRALVIRDPKEARLQVCALLDSNSPVLDELLRRVSLPGEGRLRHLIANAVRTRPGKDNLVRHLTSWLETETDEFARRAIIAALDGVELPTLQKQAQETLVNPRLLEAYRYVRGRLSHKIRNALEAPEANIRRLRSRFESYPGAATQAEILDLLSRLQDSFQRVGRIVEFNPDDQWFCIRTVRLGEWLRGMNAEYAKQYTDPIRLEITPVVLADGAQIRASDHLLDAIFWNLWMNAHQQAAKGDCSIIVKVETQGGNVMLTLIDNSGGFNPMDAELAFREPFSSRGTGHGKGLLEVQAAVEELHGTAAIIRQPTGDFRIMLSFPLELS